MMKGTPCSRGNCAPLKTSSKTSIRIEVQGLGPWRGLGQRPNLTLLHRSIGSRTGYNSPAAPIPRSGFVQGSIDDLRTCPRPGKTAEHRAHRDDRFPGTAAHTRRQHVAPVAVPPVRQTFDPSPERRSTGTPSAGVVLRLGQGRAVRANRLSWASPHNRRGDISFSLTTEERRKATFPTARYRAPVRPSPPPARARSWPGQARP